MYHRWDACCWDGECPQHKQMREIYDEDGYPVLIEDLRTPGWFARRCEAWEKLLSYGSIGTGGRQ